MEVGVILCIVGFLATSLPSTYLKPVANTALLGFDNKMSAEVCKGHVVGAKSPLFFESHFTLAT